MSGAACFLVVALLGGRAAAAPAPGPVTLDVVSVNLWGVPDLVHPLHPNQRRLRGALGSYLGGADRFDVVALQEVWRELWGPDQRRGGSLAGAFGVKPTWLTDAPGTRRGWAPLPDQETGLAFAIPGGPWAQVGPPEQVAFTAEGRSFDGFKQKGYASVVLRADTPAGPSVEVRVVNTHLQAENLFGARRDAEVRRAQVEETLAALAGEKRPVVWIGDFNLAEGHGRGGEVDQATVAAVRAAGFREAADFVPDLARTASSVWGERFDRLWVRDSAEWALEVQRAAPHVNGGDLRRRSTVMQLSDHCPLEAEIAVVAR